MSASFVPYRTRKYFADGICRQRGENRAAPSAEVSPRHPFVRDGIGIPFRRGQEIAQDRLKSDTVRGMSSCDPTVMLSPTAT